jgi:predicted RNase H-like HicB family nuclease
MKVRVSLEVEIHPAEEGGYWATVKNLPGCVSEGDTLAEVRRNIREAIECHLDLPKKATTKRKTGTAAK